jgi:hypothetical protein
MMNRYMFADRLLLFVSCLALIITMGFVAMIFIDLNDIWSEILKYQERINNLETLIMMHNNAIANTGCNI